MSGDQIDVFLSYAHQNDQPPPGVPTGWVTTLRQHLEAALGLKLPRPGARVFQDHALVENQSFDKQLLQRVRAARTLVLTLSPAYLDSPWCRRELANFLTESERAGRRDHAFVVEIDRVDPDHLPPRLGQLLSLRFWQEDAQSQVRETLGYPLPSPQDRDYHRLVNRLAHRIAERLAADAQAQPAAAVRPVVYVAEATDDLLRRREQLVELIEAEGFEVVPRVELPRDAETAYVEAMGRALARAVLFVQLLGPAEGRAPPDGEVSYVRLQADAAQAATRARGLRIVQWRDPRTEEEDVEDPAFRALVFGAQVQAARLELFKDELRRVLQAARAPAAVTPQAAPVASLASTPTLQADAHDDRPRFFVKADAVDLDSAALVVQALRQLDVAVLDPAPAATGQGFVDALAAEEQQMARCDGVLFVRGRASASWLASTCMYAERAMGLQRGDVWGAIVVVAGADAQALGLASPNILTIDGRGGIDADLLRPFTVARRRPANQHG